MPVPIVAWVGVGKSMLVNRWPRRMAAEHYRSAELVFGWSFYRKGTRGGTSSADEFLGAALDWPGDLGQRRGTPWEKGKGLAKLIARAEALNQANRLEVSVGGVKTLLFQSVNDVVQVIGAG
jgi:hypothetical protein